MAMNLRIDSLDKFDIPFSNAELGPKGLNNQADQVERFGRHNIKDHPHVNKVRHILQVIQPQQLKSILARTEDALQGEGGMTHTSRQMMPKLTPPHDYDVTSDKSKNASARLLEQLAKISLITTDNTLINQLAMTQSYNAMMEGAGEAFNEMADNLESQAWQWVADLDSLHQAQDYAAQLEQDLISAQEGLVCAQVRMQELESDAEGQNPIPQSLQKDIAEANRNLIVAKTKVSNATAACDQHTKNILGPAVRKEENARANLEHTLAESKRMNAAMSPQQHSVIDAQRKQNDQQAKSLTLLIAIISQLISQRASDDLQASAELRIKLSEAAARDSDLKAKEYDENVRKSEEMQKTMGCIGKILGWAITAVSFAAAAFTGGASLALAAVGLALTIGDEINQAITGNSFMAQAMKPIMDSIIQPLMDLLGKAFATILEDFGVDKSTADFIGKIMGAIAAAIVMVAAVMIASSAVSKVIGSLTDKIGSKVMDSVVGKMVSKLNEKINNSIAMDEIKMARIAMRAKMAASGASFVNTSLQTTGNIISADMQLKAAMAKAGLVNNIALQELLNKLQTITTDYVKTQSEIIGATIKNLSSIADNNEQAGKYITRQMSRIAV